METSLITARVETTKGLKVEITGPKDEVRELLTSLEGKSSPPTATKSTAKSHHRNNKGRWKPVLTELRGEGYFSGPERRIQDVVDRVNEKGYNVHGRMIGALAKELTLACRDPEIGLQRRRLPKAERKANEQWVFSIKK